MSGNQALQENVGFLGALVFAVSLVLGSGVLVLPGVIYHSIGELAIFTWLADALLMVPLVIIFASFGSKYPGSGGVAGFIEQAFPYLSGGSAYLLLGQCSICFAIVAITGILYSFALLLPNFHASHMLVAGISLALMFIVFFISFLGNHRVIWLQKLIIIPLLLFLLVLIFLSINHPDAATSSVTYWPKHFDTGLITQGMILAFFAFGGWESFASMTGEIKKPARTVPFVIFVGFLLTVGLYVGLSIAIQKIFFEKNMMTGSSFLLDLVQVNHLGQFSVAICFFIVFVVVISNLNGVIWSGSRTLVTLGQKGWAPAFAASHGVLSTRCVGRGRFGFLAEAGVAKDC
ncbi:APC family permease [Piscirickettsia salmonis]|uniref:APC family permease n=2 Tax=Piscirickettsia salmonis TaxID=1238 RepID=UPI0015CF2716|nr:APC family permease [Piscirickettsia salmonis]